MIAESECQNHWNRLKGNKKPKLECAWCNETAYSFISSRQLSVEEAVYNVLIKYD